LIEYLLLHSPPTYTKKNDELKAGVLFDFWLNVDAEDSGGKGGHVTMRMTRQFIESTGSSWDIETGR